MGIQSQFLSGGKERKCMRVEMAKVGNEAVGRVISGQARAASLSPERRREIAVRAAAARWGIAAREAIKEGTLKILPGSLRE